MSIGESSMVDIDNSTINTNKATNFGGGIYNFRGNVNLNNSIVSGNTATHGGGIYNSTASTTLTLNNSTVINNTANGNGGGINNSGGTLAVVNSTVTGNNATIIATNTRGGGGGIYNSVATVNVNNSTITGNATNKQGGGVYNEGTANLLHSTINQNQSINGGGVFNFSSFWKFNAQNTIIADNTAINGVAPDFSGTLISKGYNLIENTDGITITEVITGNILGQDPQLLPLGNYGGSTQTVALQPASPVIDAADPNNFLPTDQRGITRPQDGDLNGTFLPDIGAYERQVAVFTVTKLEDTNDNACDSDCSLREAITFTNTGVMPDNVVFFAPSIFSTHQTITLTNGQLNIASRGTLIIYGTGASLITVSGNIQSRVFNINTGANTIISGLTITGGFENQGAGIINQGTLTLDNSKIENNKAVFIGGGIFNTPDSKLNISNSVINNNLANDYHGGGIINDGVLNISDSTLTNNTAGGDGGGIITRGGAVTAINNTNIVGNRAYSGGGVSLSHNFSQNSFVTIRNSLISGNTAHFQGGSINALNGTLDITNVTISSNIVTSGNGGAIYVIGSRINLTSATVVNNMTNNQNSLGGGVFNESGIVNVRNTIIARNTTMDGDSDFWGNLTSQGYNLISNTNKTIISGVSTGNIIGQDPVLGGLQDNGGKTQTHALLIGSPAINAGDNNNNPVTDQRGFARIVGGVIDIGAYEFAPVKSRKRVRFF